MQDNTMAERSSILTSVASTASISTTAHSTGVPLSVVYLIAALTTASGVPWALTFLRRTNGALSIRTKRVAGPFDRAGASDHGQPLCITYASHERASFARERDDPKYKSSKDLVSRWRWHNDLRTGVLILGAVSGAVAVVLD